MPHVVGTSGYPSAFMQSLKWYDIQQESIREARNTMPRRDALPFGAATMPYRIFESHSLMGKLDRSEETLNYHKRGPRRARPKSHKRPPALTRRDTDSCAARVCPGVG